MPFITGTGLPIWEELPICNLPIFMRQRCGLSIGICNSPSATIGIMMISCFLIEQITSDPKISLIKFRNVDHRDEMTASLVFAPSIGCWKPEWTASLNSQWFKIGYLNEMKNMNGTTFGIRWNNSFQLPAGYIFRLMVNIQARECIRTVIQGPLVA